jgi:hypothetical protein
LICVGIAGCGGDGTVSAKSLENRLMPVSFAPPGFTQQRQFDWSDPVNLVGEGFSLPQATHPSDGVAAVEDAKLEGAAGEALVNGEPPDEEVITAGVVKLGSEAGATELRDWMHEQDLQQPCFSACVFNPKAIQIPGVPTATAVAQVFQPPEGAPAAGGRPIGPNGPPNHYLAEFTVGQYLYFVSGDGPPNAQADAVALVKRYYERVRSL